MYESINKPYLENFNNFFEKISGNYNYDKKDKEQDDEVLAFKSSESQHEKTSQKRLSAERIEDNRYKVFKSPSFFEAEHYIKMVATGYANSAIIIGEGGLGKSYLTISVLKELQKDFVFLNSYSTPLAFYKLLYHNRGRIIVLDDVEGLLDNDKALSILKSALWEFNGKRVVHNLTTAKEAQDVPPVFEFKGRIIVLANKLCLNNKNVLSLLSRVNFCELKLEYQEKIAMMNEIAKQKYKNLSYEERTEILKYLEENTNEATENLNFRTLIKIYDMYLYNQQIWKELAKCCVKVDENLFLVKQLSDNGKKVREQVNEFIECTGKSRATFFRYKNSLKVSKVPA